ncbi:MAG: RluA family pseudouridine synthase [Bacteroidota bacterium]
MARPDDPWTRSEIPGTPPIPVIYEDNHLLVVIKPAGLLSQEDHTGAPDILSLAKAWIEKRDQKPGRAWMGLVHRLDRPVSGVMVLAKTSKAASRISEQIRQRTVEKSYLLVCSGVPDPAGEWSHHLKKEPGSNTSRVVQTPGKGSKESRLRFRNLATTSDRSASLVHVELITGRSHQIRVQFAHMGYPLLGDRKYGGPKTSLPAPALLSGSFSLDHPTQKERLRFVAPLPDKAPWNRFGGTEAVRDLL